MKFKIIFLSLIFSVIPFVSKAQSPLAKPIGGKILMSMYCTCSNNFYVLVSDTTKMMTPTPIIYQPGISRLNQNYNVFTSKTNVLGTYSSFGSCLMYSGSHCHPLQTRGTISSYPGPGIGTSSY